MERLIHVFLTRIYPASLFLLVFCSQRKEHHIPYEQMPLELEESAPAELLSWLDTFKRGYYDHDLIRLSQIILDREAKSIENAPNSELDPEFSKRRAQVIDAKESSKEKTTLQKKTFLTQIDFSSPQSIKRSLESFSQETALAEAVGPASPLIYDSKERNLLAPLLRMRSSDLAMAKLLQLLLAQSRSRKDIRALQLAAIYTPHQSHLGYQIHDQEQGWLLFGYDGSALGNGIIYFGPTAKLSGPIAIIDFEIDLIVRALEPFIKNPDSTRNFALKHSGHKFHYRPSALEGTFNGRGDDFFRPNPVSESEEAPFLSATSDGQILATSELRYSSGLSLLSAVELKASLAAHDALQKRLESERRLAEERKRLGDRFLLEGPWAHSFGGTDKIQSFTARVLAPYNKEVAGYKFFSLKRDRSCSALRETDSALQNREFLLSWGIAGLNQSWIFEELGLEKVGLCRTRTSFGNLSESDLIPQHSRILQPFYLLIPNNPSRLAQADFLAQRTTLEASQNLAAQVLRKEFCYHLAMKDLETALGARAPLVERLWTELFHSPIESEDHLLGEQKALYNIFPVRCLFLPQPGLTSAPQPKAQDQSSNEDSTEITVPKPMDANEYLRRINPQR